MKSLSILLALPLCSLCSCSTSYLKPKSEIPRVGLVYPTEAERTRLIHGGIRESILEHCPKGSSRKEVASYTQENFREEIENTNPNELSYRINGRLLWPVAKVWQVVTFKFNRFDRLEDVEVDSDGVGWITAQNQKECEQDGDGDAEQAV